MIHYAVLLSLTWVGFMVEVSAQNEQDALRFSRPLLGGTARSAALAGAFGALGADLSAADINPAGLGLYRTSEFVITPALDVNTSKDQFYGQTAEDSNTRFFFNDLGMVLNFGSKEGSKWQGSSFGVSYDRIRSFHWNSIARNEMVGSTLLQQFANEANGTDPGSLYQAYPWTSGLAWDAYAIDPLDTVQNSYIPAIPAGGPVSQTHIVRSGGAQSNTSIFFATNYDHRLFLGMTLGIVGVRFDRSIAHTESTDDQNIDLSTFTYREDLTTSGSGINFKLGAIYRFGDRFRAGASVHTPLFMSLTDAWVAQMSTEFRSGANYNITSEEGIFNYRLHSPWRFITSAAYILGKRGLLSIDHEYTDVSSARFRKSTEVLDAYDFNLENQRINDRFRGVHSVRFGTEWRSGSWYLRGGVGFWEDPYVEEDVLSGATMKMYAGGVGYRVERHSFDMTYQTYSSQMNSYPYDPALVEPVISDGRTDRILLTYAFRP